MNSIDAYGLRRNNLSLVLYHVDSGMDLAAFRLPKYSDQARRIDRAEEILTALNCHDELVATLKRANFAIYTGDIDVGLLGRIEAILARAGVAP